MEELEEEELKEEEENKIITSIRNEFRVIIKGVMDEYSLKSLTFLFIIFKKINKKEFIKKRAIYYEAVNIFKTQKSVNLLIKKYLNKFKCKEEDLFIRPGLKGIFIGEVEFVYFLNNKNHKMKGKNLIPDMLFIKRIKFSFVNVLIVEKDTIIDKILFTKNFLIVCGKGFPCKNTQNLINEIFKENENCNFYALTDYDPYGLMIYLTYKKLIPSLERIGLGAEDLLKYQLSKFECIPLTENDMKLINKLIKNVDLYDEVLFLSGFGYKMELEVLFNNFRHLNIDKYIRKRTEGEAKTTKTPKPSKGKSEDELNGVVL